MRIPLFLAGWLLAGGALAEPDTFGLGTGRDGVLQVLSPNRVINHVGALTANAAAGTKELTISNAGAFKAGELVLVHQSTGLLPAPASGDAAAIPLEASPVGRFEYARVEAATEASLRLTAPLQRSYAASAAQVVNVPEYTDVLVVEDGSLKAVPWNGSAGGILALMATGTLTNGGLIGADGAGFRGGAFINHLAGEGCTALDEAPGVGSSYKGEGLVAGRFGIAGGRGNLANAGGAGNCHSSGGGGGGHSGAGGQGGYSLGRLPQPDDVGGLGGAPLVYLPYERLVFGGGGGGGSGHVDVGTPGAAGGGVVLIRARDVVGTGRFSAMGASADYVASAGDDGAGGGGAGGAISLRAERTLTCGLVQASGGAGGDTRNVTNESGPGGGGGGGVVLLQGEFIACKVSVVAGYPGQSTAAGGPFGAGPSTIDSGAAYGSETTYSQPFRVPSAPVLTQPANGATGVARKPRIEGTAQPGVSVHLFLEGTEYAQVTADSTGAFVYDVPADLAEGAHELWASAEELGSYSLQSTPNRFDVTASSTGGVTSPSVFEVGCGCGASPGAGVGALTLVLVLGAARRRRQE
ncbi:adventurous gliding motility protein AgmC [Hyalangium minutum]|uniref:PE-PGRS family protein n=1 Tax=Hyalangium minutum TaxID=394096 RepID=A0A085WK95_9BACT|nr:MYXO-CTERM sorting domain-containing protein [Hyalangium minutum]KFE68108.1 hypothetical protein DB31_7345 [Hyalangium minutum]